MVGNKSFNTISKIFCFKRGHQEFEVLVKLAITKSCTKTEQKTQFNLRCRKGNQMKYSQPVKEGNMHIYKVRTCATEQKTFSSKILETLLTDCITSIHNT